jgi:hypothetical protein
MKSADAERLAFDLFIRECRFYGRLSRHGLNGRHTPRCHGSVLVPRAVERQFHRQFPLGFVWERGAGDEHALVRAIVFEYLGGGGAQSLAYVPLTAPIAQQARDGLAAFHHAGAILDEFTAHNIVVQQQQNCPSDGHAASSSSGSDGAGVASVYWVNAPIRVVLPHPLQRLWPAKKVAKAMHGNRLELELGFLWLSEVSFFFFLRFFLFAL